MWLRWLLVFSLLPAALALPAQQTRLQDLDARLDTPVTLEIYGRPLWEAAQTISRKTGARIQVEREIRDQGVVIAVSDLPARQLLEGLTRLFGYSLTPRIGKEGQSYILTHGKIRSERKRLNGDHFSHRFEVFQEGYNLMRRAASASTSEHRRIVDALMASSVEGRTLNPQEVSRQVEAAYRFVTLFPASALYGLAEGAGGQQTLPWQNLTLRQQRALSRALSAHLPPGAGSGPNSGIVSVTFTSAGQIGVDYFIGGSPGRMILTPPLLFDASLLEENAPAPPSFPVPGGTMREAVQALRESQKINLISDYWLRYDLTSASVLERFYGYLADFTGGDASPYPFLRDIESKYLMRVQQPAGSLYMLRSRSWFLDETLEIPAALLDVLLDPATLYNAYTALNVRSQAAAALDDRRLALLSMILSEEFKEENDLEAHAAFYRFYASLSQPQRGSLIFSEGLLVEDMNRDQQRWLEMALSGADGDTLSFDPEALAGVNLNISGPNASGEAEGEISGAAPAARIAYQLRSLSYQADYHDRALLEGVVTAPRAQVPKGASAPPTSEPPPASETPPATDTLEAAPDQ
ncbi:MAG: hypothetical protein IT210_25640 [Armatimonadetes bacterium]|nr:hypothetical protein [Armatimonadota bacterium]